MGKPAGYYLISLASFVFFIFIFQSVANAQENSSGLTSPDLPVPTPTIYLAPTGTPTPIPTSEPTGTPIPTLVPTAIPTATPIPTVIPTATPTTTPSPTDPPQPDGGTLDGYFTTYANQYHVSSSELEKIAQCESGFNTNSDNDGMYLGMFQFAQGSWISARSRMGMDTDPSLRTNAQDAIQTAAFMLSQGDAGAWPNCN